MKSKINKRGKGFKGCLQYIFSVKKDKEDKPVPDFICSNMFGENIKELTQEFTQTRNIRPDVDKPVWHTSLSLTPEEEKLGPEKWQEIAENYLEKMGFDLANNQYVVVRHNDTEKDHIHILANRVGLDGTVWAGKFEALKSIDVCQELEKSHGLTITKGLDRSDKPDVKTPTKEEIEMGLRQNTKPPRIVLQDTITEALADKPDTASFLERMEAAGVSVAFNKASTGRISGVSFGYAGIHFKGSQLGKKFGWNKIAEVLNYEQDRDFTHIRDINTTADITAVEAVEQPDPGVNPGITEQPAVESIGDGFGRIGNDYGTSDRSPSNNGGVSEQSATSIPEISPRTRSDSYQEQRIFSKPKTNYVRSLERIKSSILRFKESVKSNKKIRNEPHKKQSIDSSRLFNHRFGSRSIGRILDYAETAADSFRQQSSSGLYNPSNEKIRALKLRLGLIKPEPVKTEPKQKEMEPLKPIAEEKQKQDLIQQKPEKETAKIKKMVISHYTTKTENYYKRGVLKTRLVQVPVYKEEE
ncbi:relaxase/mobilization nuclease domain-containing protein [Rosenbergiella epipactidis]|uniref:relaxase/mobilization nuclease domain-containing protein n=1 Tax=Rosenbergiella epipactidis TaxID=1544694 RepID=UPI001F4D5735|nr:relaxase/mobilization nuclease domain-containing protein [Rosenbergiella epipactidis]